MMALPEGRMARWDGDGTSSTVHYCLGVSHGQINGELCLWQRQLALPLAISTKSMRKK
jgi:hypothetical protein